LYTEYQALFENQALSFQNEKRRDSKKWRKSAKKWISDFQSWKSTEIPVSRPKFVNSVKQAQTGDSGIVHLRANDLSGFQDSTKLLPVPFRFHQQNQ
jgi:transposase